MSSIIKEIFIFFVEYSEAEMYEMINPVDLSYDNLYNA